jgi:hypothetical protein
LSGIEFSLWYQNRVIRLGDNPPNNSTTRYNGDHRV